MHSHTVARLSFAFAVFATPVIHAGGAAASCNVIPAARVTDFYFSVDSHTNPTEITGKIDSRTLVPDERVTVAVNDCGGATAFEVARRLEYEIELDFQGTAQPLAPRPLRDPEFPKSCEGATTCATLSFTFPDTGLIRTNGYAGPVKLKIFRPGDAEPKVRIDRLYLPMQSCPTLSDLSLDSVFQTLVALPRKNDFRPTGSNENEVDRTMFGALDFFGNLLIPFDFSGEIQQTAAPVGTLLHGLTDIDAEQAQRPGVPRKLRERLAQQADRDRVVRVFTFDGKPLPPLRKVTDEGGIFGLVDAPSSVIRIENIDAQFGGMNLKLFDLTNRILQPGAPVTLTYKAKKGVETPVPLIGLRTSKETIAYARDEAYEDIDLNNDKRKSGLIPEVIDVRTGVTQRPGVEAAARPAGNVMAPVLEVGDEYMAFLSPERNDISGVIENHVHRIFRNTGTSVGGTPDASNAALIAGGPIALSADAAAPPSTRTRAFYLSPEDDYDELTAVRLSDGSGAGNAQPAVKVAVASGAAVHLVPERVAGDSNADSDNFDDVAYFYGPGTGGAACSKPLRVVRSNVNVPVAASDVAISDQVIVASVSEHAQYGDDLNGDGDAADDVVYVWSTADVASNCYNNTPALGTSTGYAADTIAAWGEWAVWIAPEAAQEAGASYCADTTPAGGCDLNGDDDPNDRVLMTAKVFGGGLSVQLSKVAVADFQLGKPEPFGVIALRVPEAAQQANLNGKSGDTDWNDSVLHTYRPDCRDGALQNSGWSAVPCTFAACDSRYPYRVDGDTVWFLTDQRQTEPVALAAFVAPRCNRFIDLLDIDRKFPDQFFNPLLLFPFPVSFVGEPVMMIDAAGDGPDRALFVAGDADGDAVLDPLDNCVEFPNADLLDADADGIGDRYCDPTPAACPPRPLSPSKCAGDRRLTNGNLCLVQGADTLEFAWNWSSGSGHLPVDLSDPIHGEPHYSLCIYSSANTSRPLVASAALPWPECGQPPCWSGDEVHGFALTGDGELLRNLDRLVVPGQETQRTLYAKGSVPLRGLAGVSLDARTTVQLIRRGGASEQQCWASTHAPVQNLAACPDPTQHGGGRAPSDRTAPAVPRS